ncbi:potassium channel SKOR-like [Pyrus ussuriensis x Pyrus communis]|uniref:Potassium channel SKOR-like n=1 Tax=Pyrus ussuriensis x Pyrus communis TaxID=2448454 RepID=A0A5N5FG62_9ROSA|nr:potassium channel SKOR-like [Pyrus ussuriensis x Pyrus communis]
MSQMPLDEDLNMDLSPIFDRCLDSSCPICCENYSNDCLVNLDLPPEFDRSPYVYTTSHVCCQSSCVVHRNVDMEFCLIIKNADYKELVKFEFHDLMSSLETSGYVDLIGVDVFYFRISKVLVDIINQMKENVKVARYAIKGAFHTSTVNIKCSKYLFVWTGRVQFYGSKSDDDPNLRTNSLQAHENDAGQGLKALLHKITGN